ncbi:MAG: hypothetical protein ACLT3Y_07030 [Ruminococcus callidus]
MLEDAVNQWTDHLKGWDGWKFDHVKVEVVGYAVLDKTACWTSSRMKWSIRIPQARGCGTI